MEVNTATGIVNKSMSRSDLMLEEARHVVTAINDLINTLYSRNLYMSSWYGSLETNTGRRLSDSRVKYLVRRLLGRTKAWAGIGMDNRGTNYRCFPSYTDDKRFPWYLYWEIFWVMKNGLVLNKTMRILDAGGASSLFSCYLANLGIEVHSIDLDEALVNNGDKMAKAMGWNMHSYVMNMTNLEFEDEYFDHAYSICVFQHLDYDIKQSALAEICRCLKPGGILSITFDYRNPAPLITGLGPDPSERNQLKTKQDIERCFLSTGHFDLIGNQEFYDNRESYLVHPQFGNFPYTFGAIFLRKKSKSL
jgi:ubiquinone/menaquinone biosynthesis C-methylase UbiE